jgi:hypothetical protein
MHPKIAEPLLAAILFSIFKLKSPQISTQFPQPVHKSGLTEISAASLALEVGIAILNCFSCFHAS